MIVIDGNQEDRDLRIKRLALEVALKKKEPNIGFYSGYSDGYSDIGQLIFIAREVEKYLKEK